MATAATARNIAKSNADAAIKPRGLVDPRIDGLLRESLLGD
jgi:hypothetical protein